MVTSTATSLLFYITQDCLEDEKSGIANFNQHIDIELMAK
jgi:hypothetical protein